MSHDEVGFKKFMLEVAENEKQAKAYGVPTPVYICYKIRLSMQKKAPVKFKPWPDKPDDYAPDFPTYLEALAMEGR